MNSFLHDLKHAFKTIFRSRGFAAAAIAAMALGIGANTAIFSVVYAVLLQSLPYGDPSQLVQVWHTPPQRSFPGVKLFSVSAANFLDWKARNHVFENMAITAYARHNFSGAGQPTAVDTREVSSDYFPVLRVTPELGRTFSPEEDQPGRNHVAVLSHSFWREHFASDPGVIGRSIQLDGQGYTVIGVTRQGLDNLNPVPLFTPLAMTPEQRVVRGEHHYSVIARLKKGVSIEQAQGDLDTISRQLEREYPEDDTGWGAKVMSVRESLVGDIRPALLVLLGAVAFVLLIACANVANLVLARTLGRRKEIAIRTALGATRARVIRQIVSESMVLSLAGGIFGLLLAHFALRLILHLLPDQLPGTGNVGLSPVVLLFTFLLSILTGVFAGLAPAWSLSRANVNESLKQGLGRTDGDSGRGAARNSLVTTEVALSLMLLIGSGLMIRSLSHLRGIDPGFEATHAVTVKPAVARDTFRNPAEQDDFYRTVLDRTRALPGVEAAGAVDDLPLQGGSMQPIAIAGRPVVAMSEQPEVAVRVITPGYRNAMHIPLVRGRDFAESDAAGRPGVALISAAMAKRFWPGSDPLGQHLSLSFFDGPPREIVGIVGDVKQNGLTGDEDSATVYTPAAQITVPKHAQWRSFSLAIVVRSRGEAATTIPEVIQVIHAVNPALPVTHVSTLGDFLDESLSQQRFSVSLLGTFAGLALLLTGLGIYSVLSYAVRRRLREIGIRMALGAQLRDVVRMVLLDGLKPTLVGIVLGTLGALALHRVLASVIYGVSATDLRTFSAGSLFLLGVAVFASLIPAYRATRVQPVQTLREE